MDCNHTHRLPYARAVRMIRTLSPCLSYFWSAWIRIMRSPLYIAPIYRRLLLIVIDSLASWSIFSYPWLDLASFNFWIFVFKHGYAINRTVLRSCCTGDYVIFRYRCQFDSENGLSPALGCYGRVAYLLGISKNLADFILSCFIRIFTFRLPVPAKNSVKPHIFISIEFDGTDPELPVLSQFFGHLAK